MHILLENTNVDRIFDITEARWGTIIEIDFYKSVLNTFIDDAITFQLYLVQRLLYLNWRIIIPSAEYNL